MSEAVLKAVQVGKMGIGWSKLSVSPHSIYIFGLGLANQMRTLIENILLQTSPVSLGSPKALLNLLSDASWSEFA